MPSGCAFWFRPSNLQPSLYKAGEFDLASVFSLDDKAPTVAPGAFTLVTRPLTIGAASTFAPNVYGSLNNFIATDFAPGYGIDLGKILDAGVGFGNLDRLDVEVYADVSAGFTAGPNNRFTYGLGLSYPGGSSVYFKAGIADLLRNFTDVPLTTSAANPFTTGFLPSMNLGVDPAVLRVNNAGGTAFSGTLNWTTVTQRAQQLFGGTGEGYYASRVSVADNGGAVPAAGTFDPTKWYTSLWDYTRPSRPVVTSTGMFVPGQNDQSGFPSIGLMAQTEDLAGNLSDIGTLLYTNTQPVTKPSSISTLTWRTSNSLGCRGTGCTGNLPSTVLMTMEYIAASVVDPLLKIDIFGIPITKRVVRLGASGTATMVPFGAQYKFTRLFNMDWATYCAAGGAMELFVLAYTLDRLYMLKPNPFLPYNVVEPPAKPTYCDVSRHSFSF